MLCLQYILGLHSWWANLGFVILINPIRWLPWSSAGQSLVSFHLEAILWSSTNNGYRVLTPDLWLQYTCISIVYGIGCPCVVFCCIVGQAKEKERRLKAREEKMEQQRLHQEERVRRALERAKAEPKKKVCILYCVQFVLFPSTIHMEHRCCYARHVDVVKVGLHDICNSWNLES